MKSNTPCGAKRLTRKPVTQLGAYSSQSGLVGWGGWNLHMQTNFQDSIRL